MEAVAIGIDRTPRLIRFCFIGGFCTLIQMGFLYVFVNLGVQKNLANFVAFIISVQISFPLNYFITWHDRREKGSKHAKLAKLALQWVSFNSTYLVGMVVNQLAFAISLLFVHYIVAGILGILVAMGINYTVGNKFIFARQKAEGGHEKI